MLPKMLPSIFSPKNESTNPFHHSNSQHYRSTRNSSIRLQSLNERGLQNLEQTSDNRVVTYPNKDKAPESTHDQLNLMIVRGQDPTSFIDNFHLSSQVSLSPTQQKKGLFTQKVSPREIRLKYATGLEPHPEASNASLQLMKPQAHGSFTHRQSLAERGLRQVQVHNRLMFDE